MGTGSFNLSELFNRLGIKNPQPTVSERITPVINVGNFDDLTPQYTSPMATFGGDVAAVAAEFSMATLTSLATGGTLIRAFGGVGLAYGIRAAGPPANVIGTIIPTGVFSTRPFLSRVVRGTDVAIGLGSGGVDQIVQVPQSNTPILSIGGDLWLPPGDTFAITSLAVNSVINNWYMWAQDIEASQLPGD